MFIITVCSLLLFLRMAWSLMAVLAASHPQSKALSFMWWAEPLEHWLSPGNILELLPLSPGWWPALSPHPLTHLHGVPLGAPQKYPISQEAKLFFALLPVFTTSNKVILLSAHPCNKAQRNPSNTLILPFQLSVLQFFFLNLFIWLHSVFIEAHRLSLVSVIRATLEFQGTGFSLCWLLWLWSMGSRCVGFSTCRVQAP